MVSACPMALTGFLGVSLWSSVLLVAPIVRAGDTSTVGRMMKPSGRGRITE